jgi:hypothetical protein
VTVAKIKTGPDEKGFIAANYLTRVINLKRRYNEEFIETMTLKHRQR